MSQKKAIIPNSFTMTNMIFGFFAIIFASKGDPKSLAIAGVLIFAASFFDFFDGAAARALGVSSPMGTQLDSLADVVAYGIAPGFIAYQAFLQHLPGIAMGLNWGMIIAPVYPVCALYRLAKFNIEGGDQEGFSGLPSPPAGIFISCIPALIYTGIPFFDSVPVNVAVHLFIPVYAAVALLMVSSIDYTKFFGNIFKKGKTAIMITFVVIVLMLFYLKMWGVFLVSGLYIITGVVIYIFRRIKNK